MKWIVVVLVLLPWLASAQDETRLACTGKILAIPTNGPRVLVVDAKIAGGTTSMTFSVSDQCKFNSAGFGVLGDFKAGDHVGIDYVQKEGGTNEALLLSLRNSTPATKPATTAPAKKPAPKKAPAKKAAAKKPAAKKT